MIYKCKNCSSSLRYDIAAGKMVCDYCKSELPVDEIGESVLKDYGTESETMETRIYVCNACGAELMINDVETATFCAYCGQPTIVFDRISKVRRPDVILPFAVTKEKAHALIERDGTVSYEDDLAPHNVAIMIDSNHFTIGAYSDLTFDTSNLCEGILVDSNGVVYVNYSPYG